MTIALITSRFNITDKQLERFSSFLTTFNKEKDKFLIGGDEADQDLYLKLISAGFVVDVYPHSGSEVDISNYGGANQIMGLLPLRDRNKRMIEDCGAIIGIPQAMNELEDSVCWKTIRFSRQVEREIYIISPLGWIYGVE